MSVVTAHMVYFYAFACSKIFEKTPGNLGWVADSLRQESIERLSLTFTANGKNKTFAICLQLSVQ